MNTVVLARHGRTPWHDGNRYTGRSDVGLDSVGEQQAHTLADWATHQGFTTLACSDLRRAVDTATPVSAATGLVPVVDARLRELDFGIAEGRTMSEIRASDPSVAEQFVNDPCDHHFPGGEHPAEAVARFRAAVADLIDGKVLVIAHSTIIRLVVCSVLGIPLGDYRRRLPMLEPTSTTTLQMSEDSTTAALISYNAPVSYNAPANGRIGT